MQFKLITFCILYLFIGNRNLILKTRRIIYLQKFPYRARHKQRTRFEYYTCIKVFWQVN